MNLFYLRVLDSRKACLEGEEARHCVRVLRKKQGDLLFGVDGKGNMYETKLVAKGKDYVELELLKKNPEWGEHEFQISVAVSPLRLPDRFEFLVEKSVELGATEIHPVLMKRTVKPRIKAERLEKIMIAALKQSKRSRLPDLGEITMFDHLVENERADVKLIPWCEAEVPLFQFKEKIISAESVSLLIGPEGDFCKEEIDKAVEAGFQPVSLGETRLRSETAAMFCLSVIKIIKGL